MQPLSNLSVIIITRNEEKDIGDCLQSVASLAGEIIVVDSGSTDRTLDIVRGVTDKVFHRDWNGFSAQKQFALEKARGPWILNIDADERVSPELQNEIGGVLASSTSAFLGFNIPYRHYFMGRQLRFGGQGGETHLRLFKKDHGSYGTQTVHEGIQVNPPIGSLKAPIDHTSYRNLEEYLQKCNLYTTLIARRKFEKGQRFRFWHHLRLPMEFVVRYFLKLGFLDGGPGLVYALLSSYYVWFKFVKLKDLERGVL